MKKHKIYSHSRKKKRLLPIMMGITVLTCMVSVIITGSYLYTSSSMNKYQKAINNLSVEIDDLEKSTNEISMQEEEYKNKIDSIAKELSKYEPIVIPDSMK